MRFPLMVILSSLLLTGCAVLPESWRPGDVDSPPNPSAEEQALDELPAPPAGATTAEEFDTTTAEERAAAVAVPSGQGRRLGSTIAALGDVGEPGLWLKTPLVDAPGEGQVVYPETGASVAVDLIPLGAEVGAGSQLSLAAMRLLKVNLTDLPEVEVYLSDG